MNGETDEPKAEAPRFPVEWIPLVLVALFGALGGCFWFAFSWSATGTVPLAKGGMPQALIATAAMGTLSGLVGVYILTASDTRQLARTIVFALLCGFFWEPVMEAGRKMINQSVPPAGGAVANVQNNTAALANASGENVPEQILRTADSVVGAVKAISEARDPAVKEELREAATQGVQAISHAAPTAPDKAVTALGNVAEHAADVQEAAVAREAIASLAQVGKDTRIPAAPVQEILKSVAKTAEGTNPALGIESLVHAAELVLAQATTARHDGATDVIPPVDVEHARENLEAARLYYDHTGNTAKAEMVQVTLDQLAGIARNAADAEKPSVVAPAKHEDSHKLKNNASAPVKPVAPAKPMPATATARARVTDRR